MSLRPHTHHWPPLDDTPTRPEIVERLRLLWQGSAQTTNLLQTLDLVIDALGLAADRTEIIGDWARKDNDDDSQEPPLAK